MTQWLMIQTPNGATHLQVIIICLLYLTILYMLFMFLVDAFKNNWRFKYYRTAYRTIKSIVKLQLESIKDMLCTITYIFSVLRDSLNDEKKVRQ